MNAIRLIPLLVVLSSVVAASARAAPRSLTLDGPGATHRGHQVTFFGRVTPAEGGIHVEIDLGSSVVARTTTNADGSFVARVHLFTSGPYRARARGVVSLPHHVRIVRRPLQVSSHGSSVTAMVRRLDELGYAVASTTTTAFTPAVRQSVYAFQKAQGIAVDGIVGPVTRAHLADPTPVRPRYSSPADHIEVSKQRQLVLVVLGGRVATIVNTSTAGIPGYHTPTGRFHVFRRVDGPDRSPLGLLYDPLYFYRGYAIHGSTDVPPVPASHGCVRVPMWEAARLFDTVPHGETVYVY